MTPDMPVLDHVLTARVRGVLPEAEIRILDLGGGRKRWLLIETPGDRPWTLAHSPQMAAAALEAFIDAERENRP